MSLPRSLLYGLAALTPAPLLAQAGEDAPALSIMDLLLKGGVVMIPIAIGSVIAVALFIERFISLNRKRLASRRFVEEVTNEIETGEIAVARRRCEETDNALTRTILAGLRQWERGREMVEAAMVETASREIARFRRSIRGLKVIAAVSPLLGLLGTVSGMIRAFQTVASTSGALGRPEMLAQGIYEAMVTTAAGLAVAIPVLLAYFFLANRVERVGEEIEILATEVIELAPEARTTAASVRREKTPTVPTA